MSAPDYRRPSKFSAPLWALAALATVFVIHALWDWIFHG